MNAFVNKEKYTVLIVDDSRVSLMHLAQILHEEYIVHTADSGVLAIQIARKLQPDIILMDVVMPQMDGYETLTMMQEFHETKDIPVIFVTSMGQDSNEEKGLRLGAVDYIVKPYNTVIVKLRVGLQIKLLQQMRTIDRLSMVDTVTGLPKRHYFERRLAEEWARAKKEKRQLGIVMSNVDKIAKYNTANGFEKGNEGVAKIAEIIAESSKKPGDFAARWDYDSFVMILLHASSAECHTIGEKIRRDVEDLDISDVENTQFTLSIGVNSVSPYEEDMTPEAFVAGAESALYLAKELGRNQVVVG